MAHGHEGRSSERRGNRLVGVHRAGRVLCPIVLAAAMLGSVLPQVAAAGGLGFSFTPY